MGKQHVASQQIWKRLGSDLCRAHLPRQCHACTNARIHACVHILPAVHRLYYIITISTAAQSYIATLLTASNAVLQCACVHDLSSWTQHFQSQHFNTLWISLSLSVPHPLAALNSALSPCSLCSQPSTPVHIIKSMFGATAASYEKTRKPEWQ